MEMLFSYNFHFDINASAKRHWLAGLEEIESLTEIGLGLLAVFLYNTHYTPIDEFPKMFTHCPVLSSG